METNSSRLLTTVEARQPYHLTMTRPLCRFYQSPGGCRKIDCQFDHVEPGSMASRDSAHWPGPSTPGIGPRQQPNAQFLAPVPRGACRYHWTKGQCSREFTCHFRHELPDSAQGNPSSPAPRRSTFFASAAAKEMVAPFLTAQGLTKINSNATDGFFPGTDDSSLSPTEVQRHLKKFLADNFTFKTSFEVYPFLKLLCSANSSNSLWTQEEGQLFLVSLTSANGSLRIADIINWPEVSIQAGQNRNVLSFQRGILPLLRYLSSEYVVKSTLVTQVNHLYTIVLQNLSKFAEVIESCLGQAIELRSFRDPATVNSELIDSQVFASITGVLHEFLVRFKNAVATFPRLPQLVKSLCQNFQDWHSVIAANPEAFGNPFKGLQPLVRNILIDSLKEKIARLSSILERETGKLVERDERKDRNCSASPNTALVSALHIQYDGPGPLREKGPRHDNDVEDIAEMCIAPTNEELMCREPPFLPANFFEAPHPARPDSMQRLLDIQFRLLREELIAPLRKAVQLVHDDLQWPQLNKTKLGELLQKQGGKYRCMVDAQDSAMFNVYTGVQFSSLVPDWKGISTSIVIDAPPGRPRAERAGTRVSFWESGKRLCQGGLIALVWQSGRRTAVHLGIIVSNAKDLTDSARQNSAFLKLRIMFFDSAIELGVLQELRNKARNSRFEIKLLVESPIMFEAIRPFLRALQTEPEDVPFSRYLVLQPSGQLSKIDLQPPRYARLPNFKFQLASLFDAQAGVDDLNLSVTDPESIRYARIQLREKSRLDPSQADAVMDVLTREVALIQGPPGTGKSFTGVEILRVLQANDVGPILMIAFTNHALDHMLGSVLDAQITNKVVRLGRRSSDERLSQFSIETLQMVQNHSRLDRTFNSKRELKVIQEDITELMTKVLKINIENDSAEIMKYLSNFHPEHHEYLRNPPAWLLNIRILTNESDNGEEAWQRAGKRGPRPEDKSDYAFWKECTDLAFFNQVVTGTYLHPNPKPVSDGVPAPANWNTFSALPVDSMDDDPESSGSDLDDQDESSDSSDVEDSWKHTQIRSMPADNILDVEDGWEYTQFGSMPTDSSSSKSSGIPHRTPESFDAGIPLQPGDFQDVDSFFELLGFDHTPFIPSTDRPLEELLNFVGDVWTMSQSERQRIHKFWVEETRKELSLSCTSEFERLRGVHKQKLQEVNEISDEVRRNLLRKIDIIGCTTTGAAQLVTLLKGLSPRVLLVEEAGQVMEAHILGSLVPSIEHLILIGDPLQLRPTLNNYSLSMDSKRGRDLYKFDMSLMERLSTSGLAMSRIDVQRRMRPTISSLIRNTLYPRLEDHDLVLEYPDVRGIQKNVFFVTHRHQENDGGDDTASKYNTYEVAMISDLVLYLLRQGCYSNDGDIVVLCAYLGQLARLRDALANEVAVIIDERDQAALDDQASDDGSQAVGEVSIERVNVTKRVRLRTVDNYQGEEGRIVILSLVRNAGGFEDDQEMRNFTTRIRPTIGFLKSENRTNVALSRAREGLYIFGNTDNLSSRSNMWRSIIEELNSIDCVGDAIPIACHRHPDTVEYVSKPGILPQIAPDGGCLQPCETRLKCGHNCPYKCHSDDPNHVTVVCSQPCRRLCTRGDHPCKKLCSAECGQCVFTIENVALLCGHVKSSVKCYELDFLENVYCDFRMEKSLPSCEHTATLACGQDPSGYQCSARCGLTMNCCSKSCNAACHRCQSKNTPQPDERTVRAQHHTHACEKSLHCGHRCQEICSEQHQHTTKCRDKCRQNCEHAQCRRPCFEPCAPCQEPCTWACPHQLCPVPCGSICVRLPCDLPCKNYLSCGHICPSVCGEDCSLQVCPECSPADKKDQVVDLILSRTLSDITPELGGLDDLVITNPACGHVFTVETLDGLTEIALFYSRDDKAQKWMGLKAPLGIVPPPCCPSCRAPISCKRYGRIIKRANLDILERNVASHMAQLLDRWLSAIKKFDEDKARDLLSNAASAAKLPDPKKLPALKKLNSARKQVLERTEEKPVLHAEIRVENRKFHCIDSAVISVWERATNPLFAYYQEVVKITEIRSAHTQAWEAAFSFLYEREIEAGLNQPSRMPRKPEQHAMRVAKLQVGQPRPLADRRFLVEAFWATIHIRLAIIRLAQVWLDQVNSTQYSDFHHRQWACYIDYLFKTCTLDASKALRVADDSKSHRQIIKSVVLCLRVDLELFRFSLHMCKKSGTFRDSEKRNELREKANERKENCKKRAYGAVNTYLREMNQDEELLKFSTAALTIIDEWSKMEDSISRDTFYQPMSLEEKMEIIRAMPFPTTGHFFTCPNGHIYVIGECGGAMQRGRCPECGASIGGESHRLDSTNQVATEFDVLARTENPNVRRGYFV